jgi:antitoxin component YwqK of YwqJK toxin-antitoxin module
MRILLSILVFLILFTSCKKEERLQVLKKHPNGQIAAAHTLNKEGQILTYQEWYFDRTPRIETSFQNGQKHGLHKEWNSFGHLRTSGQYKEGIPDGEWKYWHSDRVLREKGEYKNGLREGEWLAYHGKHTGNQLAARKYYQQGDSIGQWTFYDEQHKISKINSCFSSNDSGFFLQYSDHSDSLLFYQCVNGKKNGLYKEWSPTGHLKVEGQYSLEKKDQRWTYYHNKKHPKTIENYANGFRHGDYVSFNFAGDTLYHTTFNRGSGRIRIPCRGEQTGICADSSFTKGTLNGIVHAYDPRSQLWIQKEYNMGNLEKEKAWRDSILIRTGQYKKNKKNGSWMIYYRNGQLKNKLQYQNDSLMGRQEYYDSTGNLIMVRKYQGPNKKVLIDFPKRTSN